MQAPLRHRRARAAGLAQLGALGFRDDRDAIEARRRIRYRRPQKRPVVLEPSADRAGVEQIRVVVALDVQLVARVGDVNADLEVDRGSRRRNPLEGQPVEARRIGRPIDVEHRSKERRVAGIARQAQPPHERAEGHRPMLVRVDDRLPHGPQMIRERRRRIDLCPQRKHVHAVADRRDLVERARRGDRDSNRDVGLVRQAEDERLPRREQRDVQRAAVPRAEALDLAVQRRIEGGPDVGAAECLDGRPLPIRRQLQRPRPAGESPDPVLFGGRIIRSPPCGAADVVAVRRRVEGRRRQAMTIRVVQIGEILQQDAGGPAVAHQVVRREHEDVRGRGFAHDPDARKRTIRQIERLTALDAEQLCDGVATRVARAIGNVDVRYRNGRRRRDRLTIAAAGEREAQRVVTEREAADRRPHRLE